ncbi:hypothetical protein PCANC_01035 [Puccinia coronata f. sp. avenae]|jgi:hypothetical protein|uniref:Uncharacterized protein n=2 Tax=Puccinia coronata f. sp. avenae TaxID=200324 RepID=A0A2N5W6J3_9BASI|nr:hypothetical protein PCANC_01035 [Puccinia coronata f. sp. avenae]
MVQALHLIPGSNSMERQGFLGYLSSNLNSWPTNFKSAQQATRPPEEGVSGDVARFKVVRRPMAPNRKLRDFQGGSRKTLNGRPADTNREESTQSEEDGANPLHLELH